MLIPGFSLGAQVIRRVAELQQLVEDAENYLSDADGETTETESVRSDQYGRLKHSDSLLLLTQVNDGAGHLPLQTFSPFPHFFVSVSVSVDLCHVYFHFFITHSLYTVLGWKLTCCISFPKGKFVY